MAVLFDDTLPPNSEAVRNGASRIREMKTTLQACLSQLFNTDFTIKAAIWGTASIQDGAITTAKLADAAATTVKLAAGALSLDAPGHAIMADGYLSSDPGTFAGALIMGNTYLISTLAGGDDFTNLGFASAGVPFVASGTTPNTWANGTEVIDVGSGAYGVKSTSLVSGRTYLINTLVSGDNFDNVVTGGTLTLGVPFVASGTTPNNWTHGTTVFDTVYKEGLAKMGDGFLTANAAGRAKLEDGFITANLIGQHAVTTDKLADASVTLAKLDPSAIALIGRATVLGTVSHANKMLSTTLSATTSPTITTHGLFTLSSGTHELGSIPTSVADVVAVVINRNGETYLSGSGENHIYTPGSVFLNTTLVPGQVYFARPVNSSGGVSTTQFTLHATPEDVVNGVNAIDFSANIGAGTPYMQYFKPADRVIKNSAIVPVTAGDQGVYLALLVQWKTAPSSNNYTVVFTDNDPAHVNALRIIGQQTGYVLLGHPDNSSISTGTPPSVRVVGLN